MQLLAMCLFIKYANDISLQVTVRELDLPYFYPLSVFPSHIMRTTEKALNAISMGSA